MSTGEFVFALFAAVIVSCSFMHLLIRSRASEFANMVGLFLFPGYMAYLSIQEYRTADPTANSQIPWWYMRFWIATWISLTIVTLIPGLSSKVWMKIARFIKYLFKIWGPENAPARVWLAMWLFATANLILIRISSWGHEFEDGLPRYHISSQWLWYWLFVLSPIFFAIAASLVFWDDLWDLIRKLRAHGEELVRRGETEGGEGKDKGKGKEAPATAPGVSAKTHLILNFISDIATELVLGRRKRVVG